MALLLLLLLLLRRLPQASPRMLPATLSDRQALM
jgi:hypothetical protein